MKNSLVSFEVTQAVATICLNDSERLNPLSEALIDGLADAVNKAHGDPGVRSILLTGRGKGFCVGADLDRCRQMIESPSIDQTPGEYVGELLGRLNPVLVALRESPVPVVCAVNGVAAGGGAGLAFAGDLTIAAKSSYFYLPFVPALGVMPDTGLTWTLPRAIGHARSLGLALTGDKLPAQKAVEWGLIWACIEDGQFEAESIRLAQQLTEIPAHAIVEARAIFEAGASNSLRRQLDLERARQIDLVDAESFSKGVRAFTSRH